MRKLKLFPIVLAVCLLLASAPGAALALDDPVVGAAAVVLADPETGRVYYSLNPDQQAYPASLTKVMTVLLAVEAIERGEVAEDDQVTASESAMEGIAEDGSTAGIVPGETMSLIDLLYCAMLSSANEACNIIAEHVSGSVEAFVELMNSRAAELGCTGTNFTNTHGLPDENHYTTAADLALITREALNHQLFTTLCNTVTYTVPATNVSEERALSNSNALINSSSAFGDSYYYEYAHGVKTGHTEAAGYCLISTAERDGIRLMAVVLGCQAVERADGSGYEYQSFTDSVTLYNWVFDNFSVREIVSSSELITDVAVEMGDGVDRVSLRPITVVTAIVADDADLSTIERDVVVYSERDGEPLVAPISAGTVLGELTLSLNGDVLGTSELVASTSVELSRVEYMRSRLSETFNSPVVIGVIVALVILAVVYFILVARYRALHKRHLRDVRRAEAERERRADEAQSRQAGEHHAAGSAAPKRAQQPAKKSQPAMDYFTEDDVQSRETVKIASNIPPADNKTRRDYFEEFFKSQHEQSQQEQPGPEEEDGPN